MLLAFCIIFAVATVALVWKFRKEGSQSENYECFIWLFFALVVGALDVILWIGYAWPS